MQKNRLLNYAFSIAAALAVGGVSALLSRNGMQAFEALAKPPLSPPPVVFPIVWSVLYVLMGVGVAMIREAPESLERVSALWLYRAQLLLNFLWSIIFFSLGLYFVGFLWVLALIIAVSWMMWQFSKLNKTAARLQIPYVIWLVIAAYLALGVSILNK